MRRFSVAGGTARPEGAGRGIGLDGAVAVLTDIDAFYADRSGEAGSVLTSPVIALADPMPRDADVIDELPRYKGLDPRWHDW